MDGRTYDGRTGKPNDDQRETIIPGHYRVLGYKINVTKFGLVFYNEDTSVQPRDNKKQED